MLFFKPENVVLDSLGRTPGCGKRTRVPPAALGPDMLTSFPASSPEHKSPVPGQVWLPRWSTSADGGPQHPITKTSLPLSLPKDTSVLYHHAGPCQADDHHLWHLLNSSQGLCQSVSLVPQLCLTLTPWTLARQASLSITNSLSLLKLMSIESVMSSNHLILYQPLLLPPSVFLSIRVVSNESVFCIRWPKYWSFSFSISPSNEHPGLVSFRMDWLDLLVQGTLKSLLQHHSSKASSLRHSAFFIVQVSHQYLTTGKKTIALTRRTFVGKVMSLLFNMLSGLAIAFLPRSKCLLILWLQSPSAVILEPKKIKSLKT